MGERARRLLSEGVRRGTAARLVPLGARIAAVEQLSRLLHAGIPIDSALERLVAGVSQPRLAGALAAIRTAIASGEGFAAAARKAPALLTEAECSLLEVGERAGLIPEILDRVTVAWRRAQETRRALLVGAIYPMLLLFASAFLMPLPDLVLKGPGPYLAAVGTWLGIAAGVIGVAAAMPYAVRALGLGRPLRLLAWRLPVVKAVYRRRVLADVLHS
ncbi:MAG: type II secretion system F family protein, partial [Deltaproteobacteria bacterium]|nr:type II secretion system F family protein [Deltaproteobacteria bacterium]